jgi:FMN phosphatase YigB (HAD superfamily)
MKNGAAHYSLIIFDLDGTLTRDALDFDALRRPPRT